MLMIYIAQNSGLESSKESMEKKIRFWPECEACAKTALLCSLALNQLVPCTPGEP